MDFEDYVALCTLWFGVVWLSLVGLWFVAVLLINKMFA